MSGLEGADARGLVDAAEAHGLAPLLRRRARNLHLPLPDGLARQLTALAVRHREVSRVHTAAMVEMAAALEASGVEAVFLKGAVLAHELYPAPELRPRRDIDLLVERTAAGTALAVLRDLGYEGNKAPGAPRGRHHHLPGMGASREGFAVTVEVHTEVLSHDQPERLPYGAVRAGLRQLDVGGQTVLALGHEDMLQHLAAHLLEPARETRLINVVDLVEFASAMQGVVDWNRVGRETPRTLVTLGLMHYLTGLPETLAWARPAAPAPAGVGTNIPMLSSLAWSRRALADTLRTLAYPSPWWMHGFYGVPPGQSLARVRWTRHAPRMAAWALRRWRRAER